jgi:hypothetical protein
MEKKIPFQNRLFALILSLLFSITLLVSLLSFPFELVLFNHQSYVNVLENENNLARYPEIISQVLTSELYRGIPSEQLPKILSNKTGLKTVFEKNIPSKWSLTVFKELTSQVIDYLNFRIPNSSLKLEISELKSTLILKSESIATQYILTLPRCSVAINSAFADNNGALDVFQLPPCKPSEKLSQSFIEPTALHIEDILNRMPDSVSLSGVMPYDSGKAESYFYYYSLGRWALRLLPILAISILILIALLLRSEKNVMLKWVGQLLVITSGIGLIGLVILLIGFDQFVVLLVNRYLNNLIEGFGAFLLGLIQSVGYSTLVWVLISLIAVFASGLFLVLINRLFKTKPRSIQDSTNNDVDFTLETSLPEVKNEEIQEQKTIIPETLEEIEAQEKKKTKKKGE